MVIIWLVVEPYPSEKDEFVSWDDEIPFSEWKVIKFHGSRPPIRYSLSPLKKKTGDTNSRP